MKRIEKSRQAIEFQRLQDNRYRGTTSTPHIYANALDSEFWNNMPAETIPEIKDEISRDLFFFYEKDLIPAMVRSLKPGGTISAFKQLPLPTEKTAAHIRMIF